MLAREQESIWVYTTDTKDLAVVVESSEGGIKGVKGVFCDDILTGYVTEVQKGVEGFDDVHVYIAFECVHKNLGNLSILREN